MKQNIIFIISALALLLCQSCDKNRIYVFPPDELGMAEHEFHVSAAEEEVEIPFLSNKAGSISLVNAADESWVRLGNNSFTADGVLKVNVSRNDSFRRRADILFETDTRMDTVSIFQKGAIEEKFYVSAGSMLVYNGTTEANTVATDINVPMESILTEVRYIGSESWIKDFQSELQPVLVHDY